MSELTHKTFAYLSAFALFVLMIWLYLQYDLRSSTAKKNLLFNSFGSSSPESTWTVARILYLFLCEDQAEMDGYSKEFPSVSADVMFFCWREKCVDRNFSKSTTFHVAKWLGRASEHEPFVRLDSAYNYMMVKSRVFIINEHELNLTRKTTWTTARNILFERALREESRQGWRWAYYNFVDGDIRVGCSLPLSILNTSQSKGDETVFARHFRALISVQQSPATTIGGDHCFILIDSFLLSVSPAIGVIGGMVLPAFFDGLLSQVAYHIDAMFNAIHRDALPFLLPYCARYDDRAWATSQVIFIYRSLCLFGHTIQFNAVYVTRSIHRAYPKGGGLFEMVLQQDLNLVPPSLKHLQASMQQFRFVSALVLRHYHGWSLQLTSEECRNHHTSVDLLTCKVGEKQNKTSL